ncbi:bifunctional chorismate synthase/riboflavin reductase [NAD(P)H] aro2 [Metarhizium acridum]|nr:bifunctional chorismate synthase/riboflavin reductase [NAD(P)H] aro2 [Metarhizium acridum]
MFTSGHYFRVTTSASHLPLPLSSSRQSTPSDTDIASAGESHGKFVSCIIDHCPPGLALVEDDIQPQLKRR